VQDFVDTAVTAIDQYVERDRAAERGDVSGGTTALKRGQAALTKARKAGAVYGFKACVP
jgi:hypothetical protein